MTLTTCSKCGHRYDERLFTKADLSQADDWARAALNKLVTMAPDDPPGLLLPFAGRSAVQQLSFGRSIQPQCTAVLFNKFQLRSAPKNLPLFCAVKHPPQGTQCTIDVRR